ncbi:MAG: hypothetical protein LBE36_06550 [Flavobacteriaceae bacterium]|jgi:uncharacterized paraquat-inducible protein A|nr:hypothetical protein [Flavobacteriaceae bacterium]
MTTEIHDFVKTYKKVPQPPNPTVKDFIKQNHEIWRQCPNCGCWEDLRKTEHCSECGTKLKILKNYEFQRRTRNTKKDSN